VVNYHKLREHLADIEHQQWMVWSKALAEELRLINLDCYREDFIVIKNRIKTRLEQWQKNWKPYKKLSEDVKEFDREWADKIIDEVPFKCPVYQCGGLMFSKERKKPKDFIESEHYDGDDQTPDLICSNCGAIYQFQRFKHGKM
jgi:hypothetical protein